MKLKGLEDEEPEATPKVASNNIISSSEIPNKTP